MVCIPIPFLDLFAATYATNNLAFLRTPDIKAPLTKATFLPLISELVNFRKNYFPI